MPSPEIIKAETASIREQWLEVHQFVAADGIEMAASMVNLALKDIQDYQKLFDEGAGYVCLRNAADRALDAIDWLHSTEHSKAISFEDACTWAEIRDVEAIRSQVISRIKLSKAAVEHLLTCA